MSEELVKQLSSYKAQLQQVEVALSTDPDNEDLLKLQKDLQVRVYIEFLLHWISCVNIIKVKYFHFVPDPLNANCVIFSATGSYWFDKRPPKLTAREYVHH